MNNRIHKNTIMIAAGGTGGHIFPSLSIINQIQNDLLDHANSFLYENTSFASTIEEMNKILNSKGGFVKAFWNGESNTEQKIKELTKATIRCIPLEESNTGKCIFTGQANSKKVLFARAY